MQINHRYYIHPTRAGKVLTSLHGEIVSRLPSREVSTDVFLEDFYYLNGDFVSIEQIYKLEQFKDEKPKGKPTRIRFKRATDHSISYCELGFTSIIDLKRSLEFLNYQFISRLTQIKTGFIMRDPLIEIPVIINETKEFGCFIEIGDATGAIQDMEKLLMNLRRITECTENDMVTDNYGILLMRAKGML